MPGFYSPGAPESPLAGARRPGAAMRNDGGVARLIDTMHMGIEFSIGAWESDGLIVDPGPAVTIPHVLEQLGPDFEPRAILLTHIHLDHAGGTGTLLQRFPGTPVYVHEVGAPHVIDPRACGAARPGSMARSGCSRCGGRRCPSPRRS